MKRAFLILVVAGALAAMALLLTACGGNSSPYGRAVDRGTFANGVPADHHTYYSQYRWYVNVDPADENWEFYADREPMFEQGGKVICVQNALQVVHARDVDPNRSATDTVHPGKLCVAGNGGVGEGKVRIIEQTDPSHPAVKR